MWPSGPMPSSVASNGSSARMAGSIAAAAAAGVGSVPFSGTRRAAAARCCSSRARTIASLLSGAASGTKRSSLSVTVTFAQSSSAFASRSYTGPGPRPPVTISRFGPAPRSWSTIASAAAAAAASAPGKVSIATLLIQPRAPGALEQREGAGGAPAAGRIGLGGHREVGPGVGDRVDPAPGPLHLVAPHEQRLVAGEDVEQQPLVGDPPAPAVGQRQAERQRLQPVAGNARAAVHEQQRDVLVGLQVDNQPVGGDVLLGALAEDQVRQRLELDDDLGSALGQPLAGAQVEGHARPAPVVDVGAQRDERLGGAGSAIILDV